MTTTIKTTKTELIDAGISLFLDILADDAIVGAATLIRYHDADYSHLERIDIDEGSRCKGHGSAAIEAMRKEYGRIVAAPDSEDSRRLFERFGERVEDAGFGIYEMR